MTRSFDRILVKEYDGKAIAEILDASPAALSGVSQADAQRLEEAFGITTVRDLATNTFFRRARAIFAAAGTPAFDPGPPPDWEEFFARAPLDHYLNHPSGRFRIDFGPVYYRGRLDGSARVLVVGQDPSTNEILAQRVFVGSSGQRIQGLLKKLGITRSYAMLNLSLFSVFGQVNTELRNVMLEPPILSYRNEYLDLLAEQNAIEAVIAVGNGGQFAVENWPGNQAFQVFEITHPAAPENTVTASWNANLPGLQAAIEPDEDGQRDPNPYANAFALADEVSIPRFDLSFGIPDWHGVGGGRSHRDTDKKIVWTAP